MPAAGSATLISRDLLLARFERLRARTQWLFDLLDEDAYYRRPIPLRNPVVFYEGHLPAFAVNTLLKKGLGQPGIDEHLETIFARGIDPATEAAAVARGAPAWPPRHIVREFAAEADRRVADALLNARLADDRNPLLYRGEAAWTILEHEAMHHETLAYMWHCLPYELKKGEGRWEKGEGKWEKGEGRKQEEGRRTGINTSERIQIPAGTVTLGTSLGEEPFAWDNERPCYRTDVAGFAIDAHDVTNERFMDFVDAGGYRDPQWWRPEDWEWLQSESIWHPFYWEPDDRRWYWRGMFERRPLPPSCPVYVTQAEADAFARWAGARLLTEAEFHRAAFGTPSGDERHHPWGDAMPTVEHGCFDFNQWDPVPIGSRPSGASAFGVYDLVGNGWEWTSTVFEGFRGFRPLPSYPEYSADFFDGQHVVLKGASPVTNSLLIRAGFRNWFRPRYPYVYATFRCAW